jgi:hypothetical protein
MKMTRRFITPLLVAGAAAVAIAAAPTAAATTVNDPGAGAPSCTYVGGQFQDNQCQTPGNAQINDTLPPVQPMPQYPYYEGDFGGGFHGGMGRGHR